MPYFDKLLCPFVGCYFTARIAGSSRAARDQMREHRATKHRHHPKLTSYFDGYTWEFSNEQ